MIAHGGKGTRSIEKSKGKKEGLHIINVIRVYIQYFLSYISFGMILKEIIYKHLSLSRHELIRIPGDPFEVGLSKLNYLNKKKTRLIV